MNLPHLFACKNSKFILFRKHFRHISSVFQTSYLHAPMVDNKMFYQKPIIKKSNLCP